MKRPSNVFFFNVNSDSRRHLHSVFTLNRNGSSDNNQTTPPTFTKRVHGVK
ncbi:hypothetical protein KY289_036780 [Solanum tuberosum]|nr:hypothetical protein KY284_036598 [Solanum tuberosum]KAH0636865.1 hypothetical protein KY289_036780 [Solanum tuberosum]